jgi:hypothetical protein
VGSKGEKMMEESIKSKTNKMSAINGSLVYE